MSQTTIYLSCYTDVDGVIKVSAHIANHKRLAESNYYETPKWILALAQLKMDNLRNGWRKLCDDSIDFTVFKQITGLSEEEVNEMRHKIKSRSDCLRENPHCRKFWDSSSRRFIPTEEAGKRMGLSRECVNFHVSTGILKSYVGVSDPQTTLIDAKSIDYFLRAGIQTLTTRTTAAELGITVKELFNMIAMIFADAWKVYRHRHPKH
jgi:hypothetical protein